MRIRLFAAVLLLTMGIALAGCQVVEEEPEPLTPTAVPSTELPSPMPSASVTAVLPTSTNTPEPLPTATPKPSIPEHLALLSYRTLSKVEELVAISLPDVIDLEFSPDGRYLRLRIPAGEAAHRDIFFDLEESQDIFSLEGEQRVYFNPDSSSIAVLDSTNLAIIALPSGEKKAEFSTSNPVGALSPDGRKVVELEFHDQEPVGTTLHMIDLTTGEELFWVYVNAELEKEDLVFDGDGKNFAVTYFVPPGTYVATVWNARTGRVVYTEYGYSDIDLHPFGSEVAVASSRRSYISLISTVTWEQRHYLGSAQDEPGYYEIEYASEGRLIYALSDRETTTASFWFPPSGEKIDLDLGLDLLAVTISPDRRYLATSDKSGSVIIWGVPE